MSQPHATVCRFCKTGGDLIKGAHRECKGESDKQHLRKKKGIPPERWTAQVDCKTTCNTCHTRPRFGKSYKCETCLSAHKKALKRTANRLYMRRTRATERPCKCGCGAIVTGWRCSYATVGCRQKPAKVVRALKPPPRPPKPPTWDARPEAPPSRTTKMSDKYIGTQTAQPVMVINPGVKIRVIPSLMPESLQETDAERDVRMEKLRACGWRG